MDEDFVYIFITIFFTVLIFFVAVFSCIKRKRKRALFSTPVVVTTQNNNENHQPYVMSPQTGHANAGYSNNVPLTTMPMHPSAPYNNFHAPYPQMNSTVSYPANSAPYPPANLSSAYHPSAPLASSDINPPTYDQLMQPNNHPGNNPSFRG